MDSRKSPILLQSTKLDISRSLPEDPAGLRAFTALFSGRSEGAGNADRKVAASVGRPSRPSLRVRREIDPPDRFLILLTLLTVRDFRTVAVGAGERAIVRHWSEDNGARDRHRGDDGKAAPARGRTRRQAEAQTDPGPYSPRRGRTDTGQRGMRQMRRQAAPVGRRWRTMARYCEPDRSPALRLFLLRLLHPSTAAIALNRARAAPSRRMPAFACQATGSGPSRPCAGQQVKGDRGPSGAA